MHHYSIYGVGISSKPMNRYKVSPHLSRDELLIDNGVWAECSVVTHLS